MTIAEDLVITIETWVKVSMATIVDRVPLYEEAMIHAPIIGEFKSLKLAGAGLWPLHSYDVLIGRRKPYLTRFGGV